MTDRAGLVRSLVEAARILDARNMVVGGAGNLSVQDGDEALITASGLRFGAATPDDMTVVDIASGQPTRTRDPGTTEAATGAVSSPDGTDQPKRPSSETGLHLGLYRAGKASAIVHWHGAYSTAVGALIDELPPIHYYICQLGGRVPVVGYHLFGSTALAQAVLEAAPDPCSAVLLRNHGAVVWGKDVMGALERALILEWLCEVWWRASAVGAPHLLTSSQLGEVAAQSRRLRYGEADRGVTEPVHDAGDALDSQGKIHDGSQPARETASPFTIS